MRLSARAEHGSVKSAATLEPVSPLMSLARVLLNGSSPFPARRIRYGRRNICCNRGASFFIACLLLVVTTLFTNRHLAHCYSHHCCFYYHYRYTIANSVVVVVIITRLGVCALLGTIGSRLLWYGRLVILLFGIKTGNKKSLVHLPRQLHSSQRVSIFIIPSSSCVVARLSLSHSTSSLCLTSFLSFFPFCFFIQCPRE